ncbi:unnamed protein product, partial [Mesorhabditis belari]|uniref:Uncharacterized protein n=1 Tax=Mesorhabditis belari TaxID=2138241 RepID=A0AAF3FLW7_9BILA
MLKQLLVAFALFSVALTINCYYDWSSGKGESHTGNKMNRPCPGCDYCLKFKTKEKSNTAVYWDCGCSQYNGISGADCLRSGSQKETVYIDEAHTNISNSINCDGCDFCLKTIVKDKNVHNVNWGCGCENRNLMGYACTEPGKENDQSHNANGESMRMIAYCFACSEDCRFCLKWSGEYDNNATVAWNCGCGQWMVNCDKKGKGTKKVQDVAAFASREPARLMTRIIQFGDVDVIMDSSIARK